SVTNPALVGAGVGVAATRNVSTGLVPVAVFTDPGGPDATAAYSATVEWGDGTTSSGADVIISLGSDGVTFTVYASHTYAAAGSAECSPCPARTGTSSSAPRRWRPSSPTAPPLRSR